MVSGIEQARRDLKAARPELYAYIVAKEQAKAWDSAGDLASGSDSGHWTANLLWRQAAQANTTAVRLREESA